MVIPTPSVARYFRPLRDPRRPHLRRHLLIDILVIALGAVICGAQDWHQIVPFAHKRQEWLATFLALPHGIPSHDTFERVFARLDPQAFQICFRRGIEALAHTLGLKHIAVDGKTLRHSGNTPKGWKPLHLVSAWATACHLSLGQVAVAEKSNEITAIPRLLELLDLQGMLVTIAAIGCQKEIARKIIAGGGDGVLSVKDNQPPLLEDIRSCLAQAIEDDGAVIQQDTCETQDQGHGRKETRSVHVVFQPTGLRNPEAWSQLQVVGLCYCEREVAGVHREAMHYFIGSRVMSAPQYARALRNHWGIENNLHGQWDGVFGEDANRVQQRNAAENRALVRRRALVLLKRHASKLSLPCKRLAAALDTAVLEEVLQAGTSLGNG